jgi:hypothetical protein
VVPAARPQAVPSGADDAGVAAAASAAAAVVDLPARRVS